MIFFSIRFAFWHSLSFTLLLYYYHIIIYIAWILTHCLFVFFYPFKRIRLSRWQFITYECARIFKRNWGFEGRLAIRSISPSFRFPKETNIITCSVSFKKRWKHPVEPHLQLRIPAACRALPQIARCINWSRLGCLEFSRYSDAAKNWKVTFSPHDVCCGKLA